MPAGRPCSSSRRSCVVACVGGRQYANCFVVWRAGWHIAAVVGVAFASLAFPHGTGVSRGGRAMGSPVVRIACVIWEGFSTIAFVTCATSSYKLEAP